MLLAAVALMLVDVVFALLIPTMSADILNKGVERAGAAVVTSTGTRMLLAACVSGVAAIGCGYVVSVVSSRLGRDLRQAVYEHSLTFSGADFRTFGEASMVTRNVSDITTIQVAFTAFMQMVLPVPVVFVVAAALTFNLDAEAGVILLAIVGVVLVAALFVMRSASPLFRRLQRLLDHMGTVLLENLTGVRVVRAFNREASEKGRMNAAFGEYASTAIRANRKFANLDGISFLAVNSFVVLIYWVSGFQISEGLFAIGDIAAVIEYALLALMYIMMAQMVIMTLPRALECCSRVGEVLDTKPSIVDPAPGSLRHPVDGASEVLAFRHVSFSYPDAEEDTLHDLDFACRRGTTTAVIGGTGSGKSTVAQLILRLQEVTRGSVEFDGVDVRELGQAELRDRIGYVQQTAWLFSGTIADNLRYGNSDATDDRLWRALDVAQAADFVREEPGGLQARVAQGGRNFSGGQRQRLSIARALVKRPELYVFDDSFSALDFKTDAALRHALAAETGDAAVVIIAQRATTVRHADQIVVLDDGSVAGIGTHEELLRDCQAYREIWRSQTKDGE
jgi:ATP-binding cassette subfamily B multidrug efflux pump